MKNIRKIDIYNRLRNGEEIVTISKQGIEQTWKIVSNDEVLCLTRGLQIRKTMPIRQATNIITGLMNYQDWLERLVEH